MDDSAFEIVLSRQADLDFEQAFVQYSRISEQLGHRFFERFEEALAAVALYWPTHQIRYAQYRCRMLRDFPYTLHYKASVEERSIYVQGLYHERQLSPLG